MAKEIHQLNKGTPAFHLQPDLVTWKVEKIPTRIAEIAEESGFLTIMGYRCTVFKTPEPEGDQWAQKSVNVPAPEKEPEPSNEKPEDSEKAVETEKKSGKPSTLAEPRGSEDESSEDEPEISFDLEEQSGLEVPDVPDEDSEEPSSSQIASVNRMLRRVAYSLYR